MTHPERHLHAVPSEPPPLPWWCRTFGHRYISRATTVLNQTRWSQPVERPVVVMCARCGSRP